MSKKLLMVMAVAVLAVLGASCTTTDQTNANANAAPTTTTRTAADGSEITTTTDASGVKTETRVFRNDPWVSRVVVTTRDGRRTVRAYSPSGEEKEINDVGDALEATGDKIADATSDLDRASESCRQLIAGTSIASLTAKVWVSK